MTLAGKNIFAFFSGEPSSGDVSSDSSFRSAVFTATAESRRSARALRCACKCAALAKKSFSGSEGSARDANAPGAAEGAASASLRNAPIASARVV